MNPEQTAAIKEYGELKLEIKKLEEKAEALNPVVLDAMINSGFEEVSTDIGKLSLGSRRKWTYPEVIQEKEKALKAEKKESEQVGTASYEESKFVIFKSSHETAE